MCDSQLEKVSSCDSYLEKVSSVESLPPPPKSFEIVPELKGYNFKLLTETQQEVSFEYDLKPGRTLTLYMHLLKVYSSQGLNMTCPCPRELNV